MSEAMTDHEVRRNLCFHDTRNPLNDPELGREPRDNCYCDNCFHGRDALALEILRLREEAQPILAENIRLKKQSKELRIALIGINGEVFATCGQVLEPDRYFRIREMACTAYKTPKEVGP